MKPSRMNEKPIHGRAGGATGGRNHRTWKSSLAFLLVVGLAATQGGCAALLGAGAGAAAGVAGGIAYTNRGVSGQVKGDANRVRKEAESVFQDLGIHKTGSEVRDSGRVQRLTGTHGNTRVNVIIRSSGKDTTSLEVQAQESPVQWNKEFARNIVDRIVQRG